MPVSNQLPRSQHLALATLTPRPLLSSPIHLFGASSMQLWLAALLACTPQGQG